MQFPNSTSIGPTQVSGVFRGIHSIIAAQIRTTSASVLKSLLFISTSYHIYPK